MTSPEKAQPNNADKAREPNWQRVAIGAGAAMFLCMGLGRFSYSAMVPALVGAGEYDPVVAGYIGGANMVGFLVGAASSTIAAKRFTIGRVLWLSISLAVIGLIASAFPYGALWLGGWRAAIGIATGFVMVLGLAVVAQTAPQERRASAMSYIFIGVGCGILFGGTAVPASLNVSILAAWSAVALIGAIAGRIAIWAWQDLPQPAPLMAGETSQIPTTRSRWPWRMLVAASFLFSFGIVPHTIYWFDFLARDLGHGYTIASSHWTGVGLAAIAGPILAARFAKLCGTTAAVIAIYFVMAAGVGLPWFSLADWALVASTIIFGAQPAVSTLLGAWARDFGHPAEMPSMMRTIILANGIGSAIAGVTIPVLLNAVGRYEFLFLLGGAALFIGGTLCLRARNLPNPRDR